MEYIFESSKNTSLRQKLAQSKIKLPRTITPLLQLNNITRCLIVKDTNSMGSEYYRFLAWFEGDEERYFTVCDWDKDTPSIDSWKNNQQLEIAYNYFTIRRPDNDKKFIAELIRITPPADTKPHQY